MSRFIRRMNNDYINSFKRLKPIPRKPFDMDEFFNRCIEIYNEKMKEWEKSGYPWDDKAKEET